MQARQINALMITSGMYDGAGEFAFRVGMPGKSGLVVVLLPLFRMSSVLPFGHLNWIMQGTHWRVPLP